MMKAVASGADAAGSESLNSSPRVVVMGVSGSGKSTVGQALAAAMGIHFVEGDALHPQSNVRTMAAGTALTDADRLGWLHEISRQLADRNTHSKGLVVSCSALKLAYRDLIRASVPTVRFVFLQGNAHLLEQRLQSRGVHFMPASLLQSQLDTLEPPGQGENPVTLDISLPLAVIVLQAAQQLQQHSFGGLPAAVCS